MNPSFVIISTLILIISCSVVTHALNNTSSATCLPDQSLALLHLRQEFLTKKPDFTGFIYDPDPAVKPANCYPKTKWWKEGKDCCEWEGVTCDIKSGQVIRLDLSNSCLQGPLRSNSTLLNLPQLQRLNLAFNNFSFSQIPSTFGRLSRLTHLNLSYSLFSGDVPHEIGRLIPNFVSLDLSSYLVAETEGFRSLLDLRLTELSQNMINLKVLHLNRVNLSSLLLPESLGSLSSLTSLSLRFCSLRGDFPKYIFQLPDIQLIDLTWNMGLNGSLPKFLSGSKLKFLALSATRFSETIPESIGNLKSLNILYLDGCQFSGTIPSSLGNLSLLVDLNLSFNNFDGQLPSTMGDLSRLQRLVVINSNLNGMIPSTLGNLSQLSELELDGNFSGQLPHTLGNLAQLWSLSLFSYGGGFTGELPSSLGNLKQLTDLHISGNKISGQIPSSLRNLSLIMSMSLENNHLSGTFPLHMTNFTQLYFLDISDNSLIGAVPSSLFTMPLLSEISLSSNRFSGLLSIQNISTSQLKSLSLGENKLNGKIPSSISKLKNLEYVSLGANNLSGTVEMDIFLELSMLDYLDLSSNSLTVRYTGSNFTFPKFGTLILSSCNIREFPDFLKTQDRLSHLDLSNNKLEGKIPKWFFSVGIESLAHLNLSHNSITGWGQPLLVLPWKEIETLDLHSNTLQGPLAIPPLSTYYFSVSENNMSGIIHQLFCNLTDLGVLDVSKNNLSGNIPQCLGSFYSSLSVLNLQGNNFSGKIPQTLGEGSRLRTIDLSYNQFKGKIPQSLINCTELEVLNLGHNQLSDTFPFWLQNLPELQVLMLRFNKFYGPIWQPQKFLGFGKLLIIDLSFNRLTGALPSEFFKNWSAMSDVSNKPRHNYVGEGLYYYQDSVTVVNKGLDMEFVRILTIFTSIDLSYNNFSGEIPSNIGDLRSLIVLNLSGNSFQGHIPPSFGKLTAIESLDLSNNKLSGRIPQELASLSFLQYLNLSRNHLTGLIPQDRHFDTFPNSSFEGNSGLCGFPLSKNCEVTDKTRLDPHSHKSESETGFGWKLVMIGYGCGFLVGAIGGYLLFSKKPNLFIKIYGREKKR